MNLMTDGSFQSVKKKLRPTEPSLSAKGNTTQALCISIRCNIDQVIDSITNKCSSTNSILSGYNTLSYLSDDARKGQGQNT